MHDTPKIKIDDVPALREQLKGLFHHCDQVTIAQWAIALSKHVFVYAGLNYHAYRDVLDGYGMNEQWQRGQVRMFDVRQAGFTVHKTARTAPSACEQAVLRVAGQAIGTGHMKDHGMVAADYAIKVVNILFPKSIPPVEQERYWQIASLDRFSQDVEQVYRERCYDIEVVEDQARLHHEPTQRSRTRMYLTQGQRVKENRNHSKDEHLCNQKTSDWIAIETATSVVGWCTIQSVRRIPS